MAANLEISHATAADIQLKGGLLTVDRIVECATGVNQRLAKAQAEIDAPVDLFAVIDLRMLSGMMGELFTSRLASEDSRLVKNPNIDGYPDLCDVSARPHPPTDPVDYLHYSDGGIEVKNTFGLKRSGAVIHKRESRAGKIQPTLVWKAHHPFTNHLLALQSDYFDGVPQIIRGFYTNTLDESDWTIKQNPRVGSTMTSFCQTKSSAFRKLAAGELFRAR